MKKYIHLIPLLLFMAFVSSSLAQDFVFTEVPNPSDRYYLGYISQQNGMAYLFYRDINYDRYLYTFDGEDLTEIDLPEDLTYDWLLTEQNGILYLIFYDIDFNPVFMAFENGIFTEIISDVDAELLGNYAFSYEDQVYVTYYNTANFLFSLKLIIGNTVEDVPLPDGYNFGNGMGAVGGNMYVTLNDNNWNSFMYQFDGSNFQEVTLPDGMMNPYVITQTDDLLYLIFTDINFNQLLYIFDGTSFTEIPLPDWSMGVTFMGELDGGLYFRLDDADYQGVLYELEGANWIETPNPADHYLVYNPGNSEVALYPAYYNDLTFTYSMAVYDGMDLTLVEAPVGYSYSTFYVDNENGAFVSYYDPNFYPNLFFYGDEQLTEVPIPDGQEALSYYEFPMDLSSEQVLFFSFRDIDYNSTLYRFGMPNVIPTAADNSITTLLETPYSFGSVDFNFSDLDLDDTLTAIQIVEKPIVGILHLDGANLATGQIINVDDIEDLTYVPLNGGLGEPYDSFKFKVFDGSDFSEAVYTIYINVVQTIVSVEDRELVTSLNIFPNPASDVLKVDIGQYEFPEKVRMYLYNNTGVAVRSENLISQEIFFDVSDLPRGIYHLVVRTENSIFGKKVLLQ